MGNVNVCGVRHKVDMDQLRASVAVLQQHDPALSVQSAYITAAQDVLDNHASDYHDLRQFAEAQYQLKVDKLRQIEKPDAASENSLDHQPVAKESPAAFPVNEQSAISTPERKVIDQSTPNQSMGGGYTKSGLIQALTQKMDGLYGKGWTGRLFKTGKFKAVSRDEAGKFIGKNALFHKVWHGSPHDHNKFDSSKIGTGEGAQVYGYGLYFTDTKAIAEWYRDTLSGKNNVNGLSGVVLKNNDNLSKSIHELEVYYRGADREISSRLVNLISNAIDNKRKIESYLDTFEKMNPRSESKKRDKEAWIKTAKAILKDKNILNELNSYLVNNPKLYKVDLAPDQGDYLLWDKPLSEQSDKVKTALSNAKGKNLKEALQPFENSTGDALYRSAMMDFGSKQEASEYLHSLGIRGIKYLDGSSRSSKEGSYNYVIFDDNDIEIIAKYSKNGEAQAFYNPADQTTYFIHDAITTSDDLHGLALHEIGVHALQLGKTDEAFQSILNQVEQLKATSSKVKEAFERVPEDTHPDNVIEEALAYLVQKHPNLPIVRKFLAWLRNAIRNISPHLSQWANTLNTDDLVYMANAALKSAPQSLAKSSQSDAAIQFSVDDPVYKKQYRAIEARYFNPDGSQKEGAMLGPNGKPSNLNKVQWLQVRTDAFKKWFGDWENDPENASKVVDENGEPLVVYHGTNYPSFEEFETSGAEFTKTEGTGAFFSNNPDLASSYTDSEYPSATPFVYPVFLKIVNAKEIDFDGDNWDDHESMTSDEYVREARESGDFDGVILKNINDAGMGGYDIVGNNYAVFNSNQIKSATGNTGAFSTENNDIRYSKKQYPASVTELEQVIQGSTLTTTPTTWQAIKDKTVEYLTDSTRPFDVWTRALPDKIATARLIAAKDLAKGKKQAFEKEAMLRFGNAISKDIFELANHMQVDFDYAKEMAGQWLTMRYARVANNRLLNRYETLADEAAQALDDFTNDPHLTWTREEEEAELNKLKAASIRADKQVVKFVEAMNNDAIVDPTENSHAIGLAGGYNNKTAIHLRQAIEARVKNLPALHKIADNVYQMNAWKLEQDIKNGKVTQEAADKFDDSGWYVPLTGDPRNDDSVDDLFSVGNVNQQKDHRLEGRTSSIAQNGIDASFEQLEKSARYHGWNDFKTQLNSIYQTLLDDKIADGASHSEASKAIDQDYGLRRQPLRPGIMPRESDIIYRKDGETAIFTIHNQAATDALRGKNTEDVPLIARIAQPFTAWNARFVTQFQPTFAAINATRDILERSEHIRTREIPGYEQVDMNAVGNRALTIAFNPKTFRDLLPLIGQNVTGLRNIQNGASDLFNEFINAGGVATWSSYLSTHREEFSKNLEKQNSRLGKGLNYIGTYNNAFDIVPGFAIFKALREQGIDSNAAAATTLNLMNFHKQGKVMPLVRAAYMFAQPIAHGGHQLTITLSTQRGQMRFLAMMTAGILLYSVLRAGDDDDELGVNKYDQISNYVMERNIPIKIPGSDNRYFKMPIGFGPHQIAWGIAANLVKLANGHQTAGDTLVDISKIWVKTFAPVSPSDIPIKEHFSTWAGQTIAPSVFKGLANVAMDVNSFGNPLTTPFKNKGYAKALQGKRNTPDEYKFFAQELAKFGFDLYPEQIRELTRNYLPNFLYPVIQAGIENPALEARGKPTIEPYASRFILQTDQERTKEQIFYRHLDKLAKASSEASLGGALTDKQKAQVQLFNRVEKLQHKMNGNMAAATKAEKAHQTGKAKLYKSRADQIYEKMLDVVMEDFKKVD